MLPPSCVRLSTSINRLFFSGSLPHQTPSTYPLTSLSTHLYTLTTKAYPARLNRYTHTHSHTHTHTRARRHVRTYARTHACTHTHTHTQIHTHTHARARAGTHTRTHTHITHTHTHTHTYARTHARTHTQIHTHTRARARAHIHARTYTSHTHTHTHTHTRTNGDKYIDKVETCETQRQTEEEKDKYISGSVAGSWRGRESFRRQRSKIVSTDFI